MHGWAADDNHAKCMEYAALVESLIDEEDDMEAEFSMMKTQTIENGSYYAMV